MGVNNGGLPGLAAMSETQAGAEHGLVTRALPPRLRGNDAVPLGNSCCSGIFESRCAHSAATSCRSRQISSRSRLRLCLQHPQFCKLGFGRFEFVTNGKEFAQHICFQFSPVSKRRIGSLPKATSLIASGESGPIHMAACGAASRDYVFDRPEL